MNGLLGCCCDRYVLLPCGYVGTGLFHVDCLQADEYRSNGDMSGLYVILMRFMSLVLQTIPKHVSFRERDGMYQDLKREAGRVISEVEDLKRRLEERHMADGSFTPKRNKDAVKMQAGHVPGLHWNVEGEDVARGTNVSYVNEEDLAALDTLGTPAWEKSQLFEAPVIQEDSFRIRMPSTKDIEGSLPPARAHISEKHMLLPTSAVVVERPKVTVQDRLYPDPRVSLGLGPQELQVTSVPTPTEPPDPFDTCSHHKIDVVEKPHEIITPEPERKTQQIRDVHISCALMDEFLRYAATNTSISIETCGILAGRLSADEGTFVISALIIPKQEGSTDTVQALAEEEIFEAQDSRSLYPLGWIHTHPSQTCFLSSIDIHTQCGYQTMLDEAIAIVMAPTDAASPVGIFRLSTPGGLSLIQQCTQRGFHPHPPTNTGQPLYELCNHVYLNPRAGFEVIDLR